jgi:hypothetical protein
MQEINLKLWHNYAAEDWSIEINGLRYLNVSTTIVEELVQCALIVAAMSLSEGAARPPQ